MKAKPVIGLIQFPGSNCERETQMAIERSGMQPKNIFWNSAPTALNQCDGFVVVGGFSYEDRLRAGVIASLNPIIQSLSEQAKSHKPILGICNGAQILLEAGLVPGLENKQLGAALYHNIRNINGKRIEGGYYNDWCDVKPMFVSNNHAFTNQFKPEQSINIPFAHAEGRFVLASYLFEEMCHLEASMFQYVGQNPNGSEHHLAAISNTAGNVMAMMPHPERCEAGDLIFKSMCHYIQNDVKPLEQLFYQVKTIESQIVEYHHSENHQTFLVDLIIEDKAAKSLELLLKQNGFDVAVQRYQYWSVDSRLSQNQLYDCLSETAELFNISKEKCTNVKKESFHYLVRDKEDVLGKQKLKILQTRFELTELNDIKHGIVYGFHINETRKTSLKAFLQKTHLLSNPYVQDCYEYHQ